jgi:HD-GYP domain-containing protein (c-di-GMP phosphodiesterase class II)
MAKSPKESLEEIKKFAGSKYDQRVVQAFKGCLEK